MQGNIPAGASARNTCSLCRERNFLRTDETLPDIFILAAYAVMKLILLYKDLGTDEYYGQKFTTILFDQIQCLHN